jgi:hypothetical protein
VAVEFAAVRLLIALVAALAAPASFHSSVRSVPSGVKQQLRTGGFWHPGCPVGRNDLRLLTVTHRDFEGRDRTGQLIVNRTAAQPLARVFRKLYRQGFPIRHMELADFYGPKKGRPKDGDVTAAFECRQAAASPCTGGGGTGSWSQHAYGLAVDVDPHENPYVGCGMSRDPTLRRYRNRSHHYRGMVTRRAIRAFASIGWGWGGAWAGNTKDYMHFSSTGH